MNVEQNIPISISLAWQLFSGEKVALKGENQQVSGNLIQKYISTV